jgi:hypothetical protein
MLQHGCGGLQVNVPGGPIQAKETADNIFVERGSTDIDFNHSPPGRGAVAVVQSRCHVFPEGIFELHAELGD